jgi:hypothetical protein
MRAHTGGDVSQEFVDAGEFQRRPSLRFMRRRCHVLAVMYPCIRDFSMIVRVESGEDTVASGLYLIKRSSHFGKLFLYLKRTL